MPVFIGDDLNDEPGMEAAQALGGFAIKVGEGYSAAQHRLPDVASVHRWLEAAVAMSRLVVVSNRLGDPSKPASGGLAVALNGALQELGGVWIGWSGEVSEEAGHRPKITELGKITLAGIDLTPKQHDGFYLGYSNSVLWPAFHHRIDLMDSEEKAFEQYRRVNRLYAETIVKLLKPDDIIWVHDYHLIPLAHELRGMGVKNRMGFFLHIPFPPDQIVAAIPNSRWWMRSFFAYDLVGFPDGSRRCQFPPIRPAPAE